MRREWMMDRMETPWKLLGVPQETPVLLGFSGGADSRFLLHVMAQYAKRDGFSLTLAHVNHGIRGADAQKDCDFCCAIAKDYGLEICVLNADVPRLAKEKGTGLEEEARAVRYEYFASIMRERKIPILLTAHNADDNAETVLFHMARGSGLGGLCGIAPVRSFANGSLVRPMLGITKREILAYCEENGLEYVTDVTNFDASYARNKIRAEVLPVLESLFSGATERISEMTACLREDELFFSACADRFLAQFCADGKCPIGSLLEQPTAMQARILAAWYEKQCNISLERVHLDALLGLCRAAVPHSALSLPGNLKASVENGSLCLQKDTKLPFEDFHIPFCMGKTKFPSGNMTVSVEKNQKNLKIHNLSTAPYIILKTVSAIMEKELYWRPRKEGDRILMGGIHRSVRKLYREAGFSLALRASLPILCDAEGIVWIPFIGVRDGVERATAPTDGVCITLSLSEKF